MSKFRFLLIVLSIQLVVELHAEIIIDTISDFGNLSSNIELPLRSVRHKTMATEVSYKIDNVKICRDPDFEGQFLFNISGFTVNNIESEPAYLSRTDVFLVPKGYKAVLQINKCLFKEYNYRLGSARKQHPDNFETDNLYKPKPVSPYYGYFPNNFIKLGEVGYYRGMQIQFIDINPLQYNYEKSTVKILSDLSYTVLLEREKNLTFPDTPQMNIYKDDFIFHSVLNEEVLASAEFFKNEPSVKDFLILTTEALKTEVQQYANWKMTLGFNTSVITDSEWTTNKVTETIKNYALNHPNLYYVMLVGDYQDIPVAEEGRNLWNDDIYISDFKYSCLDNDNIPDLLLGRIPVSTQESAQVVFNKIKRYEKNPPANESFYRNAVHAAFFQIDKSINKESRAFIKTAETIRDMMQNSGMNIQRVYLANSNANPELFSDNTPLPPELHRPMFQWNGNSTQISNAINEGILYLYHRDHGASTYWDSPRYTIRDIDELTNGDYLPIVFSINCSTGRFDINECFAEKFLRKSEGGCVAIFCAGGKSPTTCNDELSVGMFSSILNPKSNTEASESSRQLGEILRRGMLYMISKCGNNSTSRYEQKIYNCFGDPSLIVNTVPPQPINNINVVCDNEISVSVGDEDVEIIVYDETSNSIQSFRNNKIKIEHPTGHCINICIKGEGKKTFICNISESGTIVVQDEIVDASRTYKAPLIKIGDNVDETLSKGPVKFTEGLIILEGEIILDRGVEIQKGVEVIAN